MLISLLLEWKCGRMYQQRHLIRAIWGVALLLVSMVLLSVRHCGIPGADQRPGEGTAGASEQLEVMSVDVVDRIGRDEKFEVHIPHSTVGKGLELRELFIAIKTTKKFHQSRMGLLLLTWISRVKEQVGTRMAGRFAGTIDVRGQGSLEDCKFGVKGSLKDFFFFFF